MIYERAFATIGCAVPLFRAHTLPSGLRVRVRLPHRSDAVGLVALHERLGRPISELEARRILRFDPRTCVVVVATAWIGGAETLVGYAIGAPRSTDATIVTDGARAAGVEASLRGALRERRAGVA